MFLVEQDMAPQAQLFSPVREMPDHLRDCLSMYEEEKLQEKLDSPVDTDTSTITKNCEKEAQDRGTSGLPFAVLPSESPRRLSRRLYQYTKQNLQYEGQTARMLSATDSPLLQDALACHLERFHFERYPIDMALRQFLSLELLPLESQQVDRVLVAFSRRYQTCNPAILDQDSVYLLAFAMLLLHTDAFHKSVRPRISKAEFVSMTEASHVHSAIREYLYDNTSLVEFAYTRNNTSLPSNRDQNALYKVLSHGNLLQLQQDPHIVQERVRLPLSFTGKQPLPQVLHSETMNTPLLEFRLISRFARKWALTYDQSDTMPLLIRIVGVAMVKRCDSPEGDKRSIGTRWKPWGMIITGSTILWCKNLTDYTSMALQSPTSQPINVKVDEVTPLSQALCVSQKDGILRLRVNERWYLIQLQQEHTDSWMNRINYVASLGSCALVWDDALMIPAGASLQLRHTSLSVPGPVRTGAQPGQAPQPHHMYLECLKATSLALAQSVLSIHMYLASHRQRREMLVEEHQHQVQTLEHMGILTPLQRATRDNLQQASIAVSHALRRTQIELTFLSCRVHFLEAEQRALQERLYQTGLGIYTPM